MYILIEGHANEALDKGHVWGYCPDCQVKACLNDILFDDIFKGVALRHDDKGILVIWEDGSWSRYIKLAY